LSRKSIAGPADLAVFGAPPAFVEPLHVGRPNISDPQAYLKLVEEMVERRWLTNGGPLVQAFERALEAYLGVKHVVVTCNATVALEIAIRGLGLTGEVIVPSYTFIATAHAVYWQGLTPVFADIDPTTHQLDPDSVEKMITPRTTGIIGVHLWGQTSPVEPLEALAKRRGLKLLFDAAHAFGVSRGNRLVGGFGACEVFSFHATKFLNSLEGGAISTNDDELAQAARLMRNFGFVDYDEVVHPGTNGKMTEACAAMGLVNLKGVDATIEVNRRNYDLYRAGLADLAGVAVFPFDARERNNYQYVVLEIGPEAGASRDQLVAALVAENVLARKYFWPGCHRMKPYRDLYPWADWHLTNTNAVAERVMVLPTGGAVSPDDIDIICQVIRARCAGPA